MPRKPAAAVTAAAATAAARTDAVVARFRLRVKAGDAIAVGPGRVALLEAIGRTGSITAAAKSLDMSYRRAWLLADAVNRSLREPALDSAKGGTKGGGSVLTPAGQRLVLLYRRIEAEALRTCDADLRALVELLADAP